jgi:uncharacterized membrane protein
MREFDAEITEQRPGRRVAWRAISGPEHSGSVEAEPLDEARTRLRLQLEYAPHGLAEHLGTHSGAVGARLERVLTRFARHVEHSGDPGPETGAELASGPEAGLVFDRNG